MTGWLTYCNPKTQRMEGFTVSALLAFCTRIYKRRKSPMA